MPKEGELLYDIDLDTKEWTRKEKDKKGLPPVQVGKPLCITASICCDLLLIC